MPQSVLPQLCLSARGNCEAEALLELSVLFKRSGGDIRRDAQERPIHLGSAEDDLESVSQIANIYVAPIESQFKILGLVAFRFQQREQAVHLLPKPGQKALLHVLIAAGGEETPLVIENASRAHPRHCPGLAQERRGLLIQAVEACSAPRFGGLLGDDGCQLLYSVLLESFWESGPDPNLFQTRVIFRSDFVDRRTKSLPRDPVPILGNEPAQ